ncbi:MAG: hypothetical protein AAFQ66_02850 [Pseudomonadota bacterium]
MIRTAACLVLILAGFAAHAQADYPIGAVRMGANQWYVKVGPRDGKFFDPPDGLTIDDNRKSGGFNLRFNPQKSNPQVISAFAKEFCGFAGKRPRIGFSEPKGRRQSARLFCE